MKRNMKLVVGLLIIALVLVVLPLLLNPGAEYGGSDDAGSQMISEVTGQTHEPWFTPLLETALGGEIPGELESLIFCVQTGIGVGILAYCFGYLVARKKYRGDGEAAAPAGASAEGV